MIVQLRFVLYGPYHGLLAMVVDEAKINDDNKCTSFAGHFDGHAGTQMKYSIHHLIYQVQDFTGSCWTLSLSTYLCCIAL